MLFNLLAVAAVLVAQTAARADPILQRAAGSTNGGNTTNSILSKLPPVTNYNDNSSLSNFFGVDPSSPKPWEDREAYLNGLALVRGIIAAGGVNGYNSWIKGQGGKAVLDPTLAPSASTPPSASNNSVFDLRVSLFSAFAYSVVNVEAIGSDWKGSGGSFGIGFGAARGYGKWTTFGKAASLAEIFLRTTSFSFADLGGTGISLNFKADNGESMGQAVFLGVGLGSSIGFKGKFKWFVEPSQETVQSSVQTS